MDQNNKYNSVDSLCENCDQLANLKLEISVLRKQIDNLNMNYLSIKKHNSTLEEKLKELEKNNEELEQVQKEKDDLFALIIHDIKNPTTIIKSLVELLRSYDNHSIEQQNIMNDLIESTKQIVALSTEISKVLSLEGTKMQMFREWAAPGRLISEVARRNAVNAKNKEQSVVINIEENLPEFNVDVVKICEVFDNMISNSIKYTQKGGEIGIIVSHVNKNIKFEFYDNGLGMSEEDLKRAFQRGAKLSAKPTGGETSTGVGLWVVKKIIEAHSGKVWIKSSLGAGTVFTIHIPIESPESTEKTN